MKGSVLLSPVRWGEEGLQTPTCGSSARQAGSKTPYRERERPCRRSTYRANRCYHIITAISIASTTSIDTLIIGSNAVDISVAFVASGNRLADLYKPPKIADEHIGGPDCTSNDFYVYPSPRSIERALYFILTCIGYHRDTKSPHR